MLWELGGRPIGTGNEQGVSFEPLRLATTFGRKRPQTTRAFLDLLTATLETLRIARPILQNNMPSEARACARGSLAMPTKGEVMRWSPESFRN